MTQVMLLPRWRIVNFTCSPREMQRLPTQLQVRRVFHHEYLSSIGTRILAELLQWTTIKRPSGQIPTCTALPEVISRMEPRTREWGQQSQKLEPGPGSLSYNPENVLGSSRPSCSSLHLSGGLLRRASLCICPH